MQEMQEWTEGHQSKEWGNKKHFGIFTEPDKIKGKKQ